MTSRYFFIVAAISIGMAGCSSEESSTDNDDAALSSPIAVEAAGGNPASEAAANQITDEYMREIIAEISSDAYEGRGPASAGDAKARAYLIGRMKELGLEPGGEDGSYEQPFDLVGVNTLQPETWTFQGNGDSLTLKQWDQFMINSDIQDEHAQVRGAEVVFRRLRYPGAGI